MTSHKFLAKDTSLCLVDWSTPGYTPEAKRISPLKKWRLEDVYITHFPIGTPSNVSELSIKLRDGLYPIGCIIKLYIYLYENHTKPTFHVGIRIPSTHKNPSWVYIYIYRFPAFHPPKPFTTQVTEVQRLESPKVRPRHHFCPVL